MRLRLGWGRDRRRRGMCGGERTDGQADTHICFVLVLRSLAHGSLSAAMLGHRRARGSTQSNELILIDWGPGWAERQGPKERITSLIRTPVGTASGMWIVESSEWPEEPPGSLRWWLYSELSPGRTPTGLLAWSPGSRRVRLIATAWRWPVTHDGRGNRNVLVPLPVPGCCFSPAPSSGPPPTKDGVRQDRTEPVREPPHHTKVAAPALGAVRTWRPTRRPLPSQGAEKTPCWLLARVSFSGDGAGPGPLPTSGLDSARRRRLLSKAISDDCDCDGYPIR
jgi:hypothetical protein